MDSLGLLLRLTRVSKRYDAPGKAGALTVLNDISLDVARGESRMAAFLKSGNYVRDYGTGGGTELSCAGVAR